MPDGLSIPGGSPGLRGPDGAGARVGAGRGDRLAADLQPTDLQAADLQPTDLQAADLQAADLLAALPDLLVALSAEQVLVSVSPRSREVLGLQPEQLAGGPLAGWVHPDDLGAVLRALGPLRAGGEAVRILFRARRAEGYGWVEAVAARTGPAHPVAAALVPAGAPAVEVLLSCRDAGGLVELEQRAAVATLRAATVLECVDAGVLLLDGAGRVATCNARAAQVLGWPAAALLGRDPVAVTGLEVAGGGPPPWQWPGRRPAEPGQASWCRAVSADGGRVVLEVRATAVPGRVDGTSRGVLVLLREADAGQRSLDPGRGRMREAVGLSLREGDILDLLAGGAAVAEIAGRLHLSPHTVRGHVKALMLKFGVHNQLQVVVWAARHGLVDLGRG